MNLRKIEKKYILASIIITCTCICFYTAYISTNEDTSLTGQILTSITDSIKNLAPVKRAHKQYLDYLLAIKLFISSIVITIIAGLINTLKNIWSSRNTWINYLILFIYASSLILWCTGLFYTELNFESFIKGISI